MWTIISGILIQIIKSTFGLVEKKEVDQWKSRALALEALVKENKQVADLESSIRITQEKLASSPSHSSDDDLLGGVEWNSGK